MDSLLRAEHERNLPRRFAAQHQERTKRLAMLGKARLGGDVELGDQVAPTKQLTAQRATLIHLDGEVGQAQDSFTTEAEARNFAPPKAGLGSIHFVA